MPKKVEVEASNLVTPLTPRLRAIFDKAAELANEKSKAEFGESIYARGLRGWAQSKGLDTPPDRWPRGFTRVASTWRDDVEHLWQPFDWDLRPIGQLQFKCDIADDADLVFNAWGDVYDDCVRLDDTDNLAVSLNDYFGDLGAVLDATVDPQRYAAILMRLPRQRPPAWADAAVTAGASLAA
jgi:hypothetical protein